MEDNFRQTGVGEGDVELAEERGLSELEKLTGQSFVSKAAGMSGDEISAELMKMRDDSLASLIVFLEEKYDGALTGFASSLHSMCVLVAGARFVKFHTVQS